MNTNRKTENRERRHVNLPIFIPHLGCPNRCVFCNQQVISGTKTFREADVPILLERELNAIEEKRKETGVQADVEIAFFGGSFTAIDRSLMLRLLNLADSYCKAGRVSSIRFSTRPDAIDEAVLDLLASYPISVIELGIQCLSDRALTVSRRGHTAKDSENACRLLREAGIPFIGQMMIGLPGAEPEEEIETARKLCQWGVSGARIYPTAVFAGTELERMWQSGLYVPLTLEDAVTRAAKVLKVFEEEQVPVIRIGLCESEDLYGEEGVVAGIRHPAFGELCRSRLMREKICALIPSGLGKGAGLQITVPKGCLSLAIGQKGENRDWLTKRYEMKSCKFREGEELAVSVVS